MKVKLELTISERALIVAALMHYRSTQGDIDLYATATELAQKIGQPVDSADDGREVAILNMERNTWSL